MNKTSPVSCTSSIRSPDQLYLSALWYFSLAGITAAGLLVSLVSNMIIIYLFSSDSALRKNPSNIIAVNLSLSDLLYCTQWPSVIYSSLTQSTWLLEFHLVCQTLGFISVSTGLASILTVLAMSIERVFVLRNPLKTYSGRSAWLINALIWLTSILSCLPPLFGKFNRYSLDPSRTSCTLDYLSRNASYKLYIVVLYISYWCLPCLAILVSYSIIYFTLKKSSLRLESVSKAAPDSAASGGRSRVKSDVPHSLQVRSVGSLRRNRRVGEQRRASMNQVAGALGTGQATSPAAENSLLGSSLRLSAHTNISIEQTYEAMRRASVNPSTYGRRRGGAPPVVAQTSVPRPDEPELRSKRPELPVNWRTITKLRPGRRTRAPFSATTSYSSYSRLARTRLQFRLARMSLYLILLWLVSWTPLASLAMLNSVLTCHQASATSIFLANTLTKLGPTFDVFIYGISHPKIKIRFKRIIVRLFRAITFTSLGSNQ